MKMNTKSKLISSLLVLVLCVTAFAGSTYAWFTDTVTSSGNKIQAGTLKVDLLMHGYGTAQDDEGYGSIAGTTDKIFGGIVNPNWEPGKTEVAYLKIKNNGNLDLKYIVNLEVKDTDDAQNLYEAMQYDIIENATPNSVTGWTSGEGVVPGKQIASDENIVLRKGEEHCFALAVHMKEEAGNQYQNGSVEFDIEVMAAQLAAENDAFGPSYDAMATYGNGGHIVNAIPENTQAATGATNADGDTTFSYVNDDATFKVSGVKDNENAPVPITFAPAKPLDSLVSVAAEGRTLIAYDIHVDNHEGDVNVEIFVGKNLVDVQVYHEGSVIPSTYDKNTGYVTFATDSFSQYAINFYQPAEDETLPVATVVALGKQTVISEPLFGGGYDSGLYGNLELDSAFTFKAPHTGEEAAALPYKDWIADYVVTVDRDLEEGAAILSGQYNANEAEWQSFETPAVKANEANRLLGSQGFAMSYEIICGFVKEFNCGVKNLNAPEGTKMTVALNLYETENGVENGKVHTVCSITYVF